MVAAGETADASVLVGGFEAEGGEKMLIGFVLGRGVDEGELAGIQPVLRSALQWRCAREAGETGEGKVEADGLGQNEAVAFAVFAHEDEAACDGVAGRGSGKGLSAERDLPGDAVAPGAEEVHEELRAAGAHQAAEAEDFAGAEFESNVAEKRRGVFSGSGGEGADGEDRLAGARRYGAGGEEVGDFAAHHVFDDGGDGGVPRG